ncbi:MAG: hypothetical protein ACRDZ3_15055 [Acidimicrobiia bacterium]
MSGVPGRSEIEEGFRLASEAVRIAEDIGNPSIRVTAVVAVGIAEMGVGRFEDAVLTLQTALSEARELKVAIFEEATLLTHLSRAHLGAGDGAAARAAADEAVAVAQRQGARVSEALALLTRARVRRATGAPPGEVDADLAAALDLARVTGATATRPRSKPNNNPEPVHAARAEKTVNIVPVCVSSSGWRRLSG